jgi:hypothetical protein
VLLAVEGLDVPAEKFQVPEGQAACVVVGRALGRVVVVAGVDEAYAVSPHGDSDGDDMGW